MDATEKSWSSKKAKNDLSQPPGKLLRNHKRKKQGLTVPGPLGGQTGENTRFVADPQQSDERSCRRGMTRGGVQTWNQGIAGVTVY